jgi:hypothetical protein
MTTSSRCRAEKPLVFVDRRQLKRTGSVGGPIR